MDEGKHRINKAVYVVSWYERYGDDFIGELELSENHLEEVGQILDVSVCDLAGGAYPVKLSHVDQLQNLVGVKFDLNLYEYFVEVFSRSKEND